MSESLRAIARIVRAGRPPMPWAIAAVLSLMVVAAAGALPPLFTGRIVDALGRADAADVMRQLGLFAAVTAATALLGFFNTYATSAFREAIARNLRVALMERLLHAKLSELEKMSFGEVANRLNDDLDGLSYRFENSLFPTIASACGLIATLVAMFALDRTFALISCAAVALSILPSRLVARYYAQNQRAELANHDARTGAVVENASLGALALLRHPLAARRQLERYALLADTSRAVRLRGVVASGLAGVASVLANLAGPVAILAAGSYLLLHHQTGVGTIVTFLMYQNRLASPFASLTALPLQIVGCGVPALRCLEILDFENETGGDEPFAAGDVSIERAELMKAGRTILRGAIATVPAGEHAAIVGPSGAGKSTLGSLMLRLHDVDGGAIRIGAHDLRRFDVRALRESVVLVPQDPLVFDTTLRENLTYLNPAASDAEVLRAIELCALGEVVARLEDGLQTKPGQRGFRFSGGERQRICVARALIARPQILILDEALTGVDVETESRIMCAIRCEFRDRTLIAITHRLHSAAAFDRVLVVEDGCVTAQGTHDEARAASGWYRDASATAGIEPAVAI